VNLAPHSSARRKRRNGTCLRSTIPPRPSGPLYDVIVIRNRYAAPRDRCYHERRTGRSASVGVMGFGPDLLVRLSSAPTSGGRRGPGVSRIRSRPFVHERASARAIISRRSAERSPSGRVSLGRGRESPPERPREHVGADGYDLGSSRAARRGIDPLLAFSYQRRRPPRGDAPPRRSPPLSFADRTERAFLTDTLAADVRGRARSTTCRECPPT